MVNEIGNTTPRRQDGSVLMAVFSRSNQVLQIDHLHPFGCTVYVLDSKLQHIEKKDKRQQRSRIRVYSGQSVQHVRTVNLVLSIKAGLV